MILAVGLLLASAASAAGAAGAAGQEPRDSAPPAERQEPAQESELDKLMRAALTGRAHIRPQAAHRIKRLWSRGDEATRAEVVARLAAEAGQGTGGLAAMGSALVEVLGDFEDPRLRARLWSALDDPDFPWRPYAARSLAGSATSAEHGRLRALLEDPIAPVRAAAILALETLDARDDAPLLRARLADEVGVVRRAAADLLVRWGHDDALWYLFEELKRDDRFFDRPTGREARFKAERMLRAHLGDLGDYDAEPAPTESAPGLRALAERLTQRAGPRPELPAIARASGAPADGSSGAEVIGLELRSCRRGEYYLRWTRDDRLLVGQGTPVVVALPKGTTARLLELGAARTAEVEARSVGTPGCDLELLHWRPAERTDMWIVSKGPDAVDDLRPKALSAFYRELVQGLPDHPHDDPRLDRLHSRALAALASVGGVLD